MPDFYDDSERHLSVTPHVARDSAIVNTKGQLIPVRQQSIQAAINSKSVSHTSAIIKTVARIFAQCRFPVFVVAAMTPLLLTGCGQSGDLYYTKDAPSNTDFILYKGNKTADGNSQPAPQYDPEEIEQAAAEDPIDY